MHSLRMAGFAGVFLALLYCTSCGDTYRPVAQPIVQPGGDPQKAAFVYSLYRNPHGNGILAKIDVSGDTNMSNLTLGPSPVAVSYIGSNTGGVIAADSQGNAVVQSPSIFQFPVTLNLPAGAVPVFVTSRQSDAGYIVNQSGPTGICAAGSVNALSATTVLATTCVGNDPVFAVQVPNGGKVYVLNRADGTVSVIDPSLRVNIGTIPVRSNPVWADTNADGSLLFVVNQGDNSVSVIDTVADVVITPVPIPVGTNPTFAIFDNNRSRLYVTNTSSNSVSVIQASQATATNPPTLLKTIATSTDSVNGQGPTSAAPLPNGTRIYVANSGSIDISVIDANTLTLITQNAGFCTKPNRDGAVSCPNSYPTIPLLWDISQWSDTVAPTPVAPDPVANPGPVPPLQIATEASNTKIYVTTPYIVPQTGQDPVQPGVTVIKTLNNSVVWNVMGPQEDPNCQKATNGGAPCPVQIPLQLLGVPH